MIRCSRKFQSRAIVLKWLYEFLGTLFVHCVMCSDLRKDIQKVERKKHFFVNELLNRRSVVGMKKVCHDVLRARVTSGNCIVNDFVFRGFGGVLSREGFVPT